MAAQSKLQSDPILILARRYAEIVKRRFQNTPRTTRLIATISLLLSIIGSSYGAYRFWGKRKSEKETGRQLLRRNSGLKQKDGSRRIFVPYRDATAGVTIHPTQQLTFEHHRRLFIRSRDNYSVPPPTAKPGLNIAFVHQFFSLMTIMVPRWNCKESGLLLSHGMFLLFRTYLSLLVARLDGEIVRDLVSGNGKGFLFGIVKWCGIGSLASYTNAMIKFLQSKVSIAFRTRLTRYIHDLYLNDHLGYYKLVTTDDDVGVQADQFITNGNTHHAASSCLHPNPL